MEPFNITITEETSSLNRRITINKGEHHAAFMAEPTIPRVELSKRIIEVVNNILRSQIERANREISLDTVRPYVADLWREEYRRTYGQEPL